MASQHCGFDLPIRIDYSPPAWLLPFILLTHTVAGLCLFPVNLPWYSTIILLLAVSGSLWLYLRDQDRYSDITRPFKLLLDTGDNWSIILPEDNNCIQARLCSASILQPGFIVLGFKGSDRRKYVFIFTEGNLDKQTLRRLRVRLFYPKERG